MSVTIVCESQHEADVIADAVREYEATLTKAQIRDYGPYIPGYSAGFGWDVVDRAARFMHKGSRTHMSAQVAQAFEDALRHRAARNDGPYAETAGKIADRVSDLIAQERPQKGETLC